MESCKAEIPYADVVLLNGEMRKKKLRYRLSLKDRTTGCIEPPGECCLTPQMTEEAFRCIEECFKKRGMQAVFSEDRLYFFLRPMEKPETWEG